MHALRPGDPERIGDLSIVGRLGEGPRGEVFLGREAEDAPIVAVKLLPAEPDADADAPVKHLAAKQVSSSYVARVLDAGMHEDRPYVVREHVEGKSLAQAVADDGPLTGDALERVAVGVLTALSAVHLAGRSHKSLTPHNVILGPEGPRVTDAGIGEPVGEIAYQAPEQLLGLQYGPYADVFAWAATIAFAATGKAPFADRDAVLTGEPEVDIEAEPVRRVVLAALSKEVGKRPTTYSALMQLLGGNAKPPAAQQTAIEGVPIQGIPVPGVPGQGGPVPPQDTLVAGPPMLQDGPLPVQGPPFVPGPPMQGPPMQGPPMQGLPVPHQHQSETPMWGPPEPDQQPQHIRLEAVPSGAAARPRRGFPLGLVAGVAVVALISVLGLWGANRYVKLQQVNPASMAQANADEIPVPASAPATTGPQGTDPLGGGADPQQTQPEATVPWGATAAPDDSGVGPLTLPTEWSSSSTAPQVPELTTVPTTPAAIPTQPVPTQPVPTATQPAADNTAESTPTPSKTRHAKPTATVTKTVDRTPTPTPTPTEEPTKEPEPTPTPTKEPTREPEPTPTPTKTTAKPTPTKTTAKPTPTPTKTTAKPTPTPTKTTAKPTPTPTKTTNPYSPTQVCGSGFSVQRSSPFGGGVTYQLWNNSTGQNCVVTIKTTDIGKKTPVSATLEVQGGGSQTDSGSFEYYAGPVKLPARGKCVRFSGSAGGTSTSAAWGSCGA
ncbi:protein kinase [Nonomuraea sp. NPDC052116]|uniref:serine/threonine protein kinase n=1 Tax=Nonomuraea sp. NPDC052116 TaxID=3155665 RepID=UPI00341BD491